MVESSGSLSTYVRECCISVYAGSWPASMPSSLTLFWDTGQHRRRLEAGHGWKLGRTSLDYSTIAGVGGVHFCTLFWLTWVHLQLQTGWNWSTNTSICIIPECSCEGGKVGVLCVFSLIWPHQQLSWSFTHNCLCFSQPLEKTHWSVNFSLIFKNNLKIDSLASWNLNHYKDWRSSNQWCWALWKLQMKV
jgi:hypothetical protein